MRIQIFTRALKFLLVLGVLVFLVSTFTTFSPQSQKIGNRIALAQVCPDWQPYPGGVLQCGPGCTSTWEPTGACAFFGQYVRCEECQYCWVQAAEYDTCTNQTRYAPGSTCEKKVSNCRWTDPGQCQSDADCPTDDYCNDYYCGDYVVGG